MMLPSWLTRWDFQEEITFSASMRTSMVLLLPPWASMGLPWRFRGTSTWNFYGNIVVLWELPWKLPMVLPCMWGLSYSASMGIPWGFHGACMVPAWCHHGAFMGPPCGAFVVLPWCLQLPRSFHGAIMVSFMALVSMMLCLQCDSMI